MRRLVLAVFALLWSTSALAQVVEQSPPVLWSPRRAEPSHSIDVIGGLGFGGFTSDLGRVSSVGFMWNFRAGYNFARYFTVELAYQGTANNVNTLTKTGGAFCCSAYVENQITADFKVGIPIRIGNGYLRPYGFGGAGYGYIGVSTYIITLSPLPSESAGAFPFGGGLSYEVTPGVILDTRYTYNVLTESFGNVWNVGFNVGVRFGAY